VAGHGLGGSVCRPGFDSLLDSFWQQIANARGRESAVVRPSSPQRQSVSCPRALDAEAPKAARARRSPEAMAALVKRVLAGDIAAGHALVVEFSGLLWAVARAYRLSDADAADVAQTTWLRLLEHLDQLQDPGRIGAWLATTARRESINLLRQHARLIPQAEPPETPDEAAQLDQDLLARERADLLWSAFETLRPTDRALLRLLIAEPTPSYEEISATLRMPIGSIGPTRARALERLRAQAKRLGLTDASAAALTVPE
jgi:RNA polymerase sigma factor (sigma-70 family)